MTHAEFIPKDLTRNYPRGEKELLGPFHHFMTGDTIGWFAERSVELKTEEDGRMFPVTDSSETIIDCFLSETRRLGIEVLTGQPVKNIWKENTIALYCCEQPNDCATNVWSNPLVRGLICWIDEIRDGSCSRKCVTFCVKVSKEMLCAVGVNI